MKPGVVRRFASVAVGFVLVAATAPQALAQSTTGNPISLLEVQGGAVSDAATANPGSSGGVTVTDAPLAGTTLPQTTAAPVAMAPGNSGPPTIFDALLTDSRNPQAPSSGQWPDPYASQPYNGGYSQDPYGQNTINISMDPRSGGISINGNPALIAQILAILNMFLGGAGNGVGPVNLGVPQAPVDVAGGLGIPGYTGYPPGYNPGYNPNTGVPTGTFPQQPTDRKSVV